MCGIVGLFLKKPALESELGRLTMDMLKVMTDRGPDSAGFAVYGAERDERSKLTLRAARGVDLACVVAALSHALVIDLAPTMHDDHAVLSVPTGALDRLRDALRERRTEVAVVASGRTMELYKGMGLPADVGARFGLAAMSGTHAIGHTRMATESAVTVAGAHPFSTGDDQCLVHNGSLSNHNAVRRLLRRQGHEFETENDSEVAAGYLSWRLSQGATLDEALTAALSDLDGFYTFVVGTRTGFAVLRDPVACKPAVLAETEDYVAFGSEYRALVDLPGIETAHIFEPEPQTVYAWERAA